MKHTNSRKVADEGDESESIESKSEVDVQLTKLLPNKIEVDEPKMVEK